VSVFVIDCTTMGADDPTGTLRTMAVTVGRRRPKLEAEDDTGNTLAKVAEGRPAKASAVR
jgi:hypothetical protein